MEGSVSGGEVFFFSMSAFGIKSILVFRGILGFPKCFRILVQVLFTDVQNFPGLLFFKGALWGPEELFLKKINENLQGTCSYHILKSQKRDIFPN